MNSAGENRTNRGNDLPDDVFDAVLRGAYDDQRPLQHPTQMRERIVRTGRTLDRAHPTPHRRVRPRWFAVPVAVAAIAGVVAIAPSGPMADLSIQGRTALPAEDAASSAGDQSSNMTVDLYSKSAPSSITDPVERTSDSPVAESTTVESMTSESTTVEAMPSDSILSESIASDQAGEATLDGRDAGTYGDPQREGIPSQPFDLSVLVGMPLDAARRTADAAGLRLVDSAYLEFESFDGPQDRAGTVIVTVIYGVVLDAYFADADTE